ncbi:hypothetical protein D3C71_1618490 [compost metagenome]
MRDLFAQVGEGRRRGAFSQHAGIQQRVDPHLPVFTAHDGHGGVDLGLRGRLQHGFLDHFTVGVQPAQVDRVADGLERGVEHLARLGVGAARGGQAVDDLVHLAHARLDGGNGLLLDLVREGVAVDAGGGQALGLCRLVEGGGVVPARRAGLGGVGGAFEKHAQGFRATAEGRADAGGQAVAG